MPRWHEGLVYNGALEVHTLWAEVIRDSRRLDAYNSAMGFRSATTTKVLLAYRTWLVALERIERDCSVLAVKNMRDQFDATRRRPNSGIKPASQRLRYALTAAPVRLPLPTGSIGIANEERMDKIVNPFGPQYGPYWRAQEYGSAHLVGRAIRGFFFDSGLSNPTKPGDASGQPIFVPARLASELGATVGVKTGGGARGGGGRAMVVQNPIRARHFISAGATRTFPIWDAALAAEERRALGTLTSVLGAAAAPYVARGK